jgi:hypothetical protein
MPFSNPQHIPAVLHFAQRCRPKSVLDIGVGMGSYGMLMRQCLDLAFGRMKSSEWQTRIDGIEIFEDYRNSIWSYAYSSVTIGDIRHLIADLPQYDLILCNDVLEHFPQAEAQSLVDRLLNIGSVLIATTPNIDFPQGAWGGNEAETHHSLLTRADFPGLVAEMHTGVTSCFVCTRRKDLIYPLLLAADTCPQISMGDPSNPWVRLRRKWREMRLKRG